MVMSTVALSVPVYVEEFVDQNTLPTRWTEMEKDVNKMESVVP